MSKEDLKSDVLWEKCLSLIQDSIGKPSFMSWFQNTEAVFSPNSEMTIFTRDSFSKDWIKNNFLETVLCSVQSVTGKEHKVFFDVKPEISASEWKPAEKSFPSSKGSYTEPDSSSPSTGFLPMLNPKYVFDTFVIGSNNKFAHAASLAVSEQPGSTYNPLFIYGSTGLGKTHLMQAIGHYSKSLHPWMNVVYVTTETFINDFINSIRFDRREDFQKKYRSADILLIDDIHWLEKKEQTQTEFFHTFNTLHGSNRQIIITSDKSPNEIPTLEERLISRFKWGLTTDIQPPDLETRVAILKKKSPVFISDEVLMFIASNFQNNIRELEGALMRVIAVAKLDDTNITLSLAEDALKPLLPETDQFGVDIQLIIQQVSTYFNVDIDTLLSSSRSRSLVLARQVGMYLCRELTTSSLIDIGQSFGGRDYSTVIHAINKIKKLINERREIFDIIQTLTGRIKTMSSGY